MSTQPAASSAVAPAPADPTAVDDGSIAVVSSPKALPMHIRYITIRLNDKSIKEVHMSDFICPADLFVMEAKCNETLGRLYADPNHKWGYGFWQYSYSLASASTGPTCRDHFAPTNTWTVCEIPDGVEPGRPGYVLKHTSLSSIANDARSLQLTQRSGETPTAFATRLAKASQSLNSLLNSAKPVGRIKHVTTVHTEEKTAGRLSECLTVRPHEACPNVGKILPLEVFTENSQEWYKHYRDHQKSMKGVLVFQTIQNRKYEFKENITARGTLVKIQ